MTIRTAGCLVLAMLAGCKPYEPVPAEFDALVHRAWELWDVGSAEDMEALASAFTTVAPTHPASDGPLRGSMARLTPAQRDVVPLEPRPLADGTVGLPDPADAAPMLVLNRFECTMAQFEPTVYHLAQDEIFGFYDSYDRTYTSSLEDYLSGVNDRITWDVELEATVTLAGSYTETLSGGLRRAETAEGTLFLTRTWIPRPAVWASENKSFDQDYQINLYMQETDDSIVHLQGVWRHLDLGALGTTESEFVVNTLMSSSIDWDRDTEKLCAEGRP
ncbi:MAG: hypothetical protein ACON5B_01610 [Myxococcota bacterium]